MMVLPLLIAQSQMSSRYSSFRRLLSISMMSCFLFLYAFAPSRRKSRFLETQKNTFPFSRLYQSRGLVEPREGSWLLGARPHSPSAVPGGELVTTVPLLGRGG